MLELGVDNSDYRSISHYELVGAWEHKIYKLPTRVQYKTVIGIFDPIL